MKIAEFNPLKMLGKSFRCRHCGKKHMIPVKAVVVGNNAVSKTGLVLKKLDLGRKALVVLDKNTQKAAGSAIISKLQTSGFLVKTVCLSGNVEGTVSANLESLNEVSQNLKDSEWILAVGTGTISDIVKFASTNAGIPHVAFFTAASINGIASNRAVIEEKGVKKTHSVSPPVAVICDLGIVSKAPALMNLDGFADFFSYPVSLSDWKLSSIINGDYYCPLPQKILENFGQKCSKIAGGIPSNNENSLKTLCNSLIAGGLAVTLVNNSAPVSGAEHLQSYLWDLNNESHGLQLRPHGKQVAIATILAAKLYEKVLEINPSEFSPKNIDPTTIKEELMKKFGSAGEELLVNFEKKCLVDSDLKARIKRIFDNWKEIQKLKRTVHSADELRKILLKANALTLAGKLGLSRQDLVSALLFARFARNRYTILDLASEIGFLNEKTAGEIVEECEIL